jgi:pyruvate formate lyase activating enzyme
MVPGMSQPSGAVFDVKRFAIHDGPGIRTTVFFKGCPLSCLWCHNPESQRAQPELLYWAERCAGCGACVAACPVDAVSLEGGSAVTNRSLCTGCGACIEVCPSQAREIAGEVWSLGRLLDAVERDVLFYDESGGGLTLSGGEPLAQPEYAQAALAACRDRRIHTAVDTCGFAEWDVVDAVASQTDLFLYDVKHLDDDRHRELTGVSNARILENLEQLSEADRRIWIRYPIIPGENDAEGEIVALGRLVSRLKTVDAIHLLPFHRGGERKRTRLGLSPTSLPMDASAAASADAAATVLRQLVDAEVQVGG